MGIAVNYRLLFMLSFLSMFGSRETCAQSCWPNGTKELKDLAYVPNGHERQKLDLFVPPSGTVKPLVVWIHGGGWESGSKDGNGAVGLTRHCCGQPQLPAVATCIISRTNQ